MSTTLKIDGSTFNVSGQHLSAVSNESGSVLWQKNVATRNFGWIGVSGNVLVGVGEVMRPVLVANGGGINTYQNQSVQILFGLDSRSGRQVWSWSPDRPGQVQPQFIRGLIFISVPNGAYAMFDSQVLDGRSGHVLFETTGTLLYQDKHQVIFGCELAPVPYCETTSFFSFTRMTLPDLHAVHWRIRIDPAANCPVDDDDPAQRYRARYKADRFQIFFPTYCGKGTLLTGRWADGPDQTFALQSITPAIWPDNSAKGLTESARTRRRMR